MQALQMVPWINYDIVLAHGLPVSFHQTGVAEPLAKNDNGCISYLALPWTPFPRYLTQKHLLLHSSDSAWIPVNLFEGGAIIFFYHWLCTSGWRFSFSGVPSMVLELAMTYHPCFYCANASSSIHYCTDSFIHTWSINFSLKWMLQAAFGHSVIVVLYKTISFCDFCTDIVFF